MSDFVLLLKEQEENTVSIVPEEKHSGNPLLWGLPILKARVTLFLQRSIRKFYAVFMKKGIHPNYFENATIACSCGAVLETGSTTETMHTEICSECHPFYTGKKKFIDATGRVDRFKKLALKSEEKQAILLKASKAKKTETPKKEKKVVAEK